MSARTLPALSLPRLAGAFLGSILLVLLLLTAVLGVMFGLSLERVGGLYGPSPLALADIPGPYLVLYESAALEYGLDWAVLAAIGKIETNHGRSRLAGVTSGFNGQAGAEGAGCCAGPMQFYANRAMAGGRTTWDAYGYDANRDGRIDVYDRPTRSRRPRAT